MIVACFVFTAVAGLSVVLAILAFPGPGRSPRPAETPLEWAHQRFCETFDDDCVGAVLALERHVEAIERGEDPRRAQPMGLDDIPGGLDPAPAIYGAEASRVRAVGQVLLGGNPAAAALRACALRGLSGCSVTPDPRHTSSRGPVLSVRWRDRACAVPVPHFDPRHYDEGELVSTAKDLLAVAEALAR